MANPDHLRRLREGPRAWNAWREQHPRLIPDLSGAELTLSQRQLGPSNGGPVNLRGANLAGAMLRHATLNEANLEGASLKAADLAHARLNGANLRAADLTGALLDDADLTDADCGGADFTGASLARAANLVQAQIESALGDGASVLPDTLTQPVRWLADRAAEDAPMAAVRPGEVPAGEMRLGAVPDGDARPDALRTAEVHSEGIHAQEHRRGEGRPAHRPRKATPADATPQGASVEAAHPQAARWGEPVSAREEMSAPQETPAPEEPPAPEPEIEDPHAILQIRRAARQDEIRAAYRKLAKQSHPDLHPGDGAAELRFKRINQAYRALTVIPGKPASRPFYASKSAAMAMFLLLLLAPSGAIYWFAQSSAPQGPGVAPPSKKETASLQSGGEGAKTAARLGDFETAARSEDLIAATRSKNAGAAERSENAGAAARSGDAEMTSHSEDAKTGAQSEETAVRPAPGVHVDRSPALNSRPSPDAGEMSAPLAPEEQTGKDASATPMTPGPLSPNADERAAPAPAKQRAEARQAAPKPAAPRTEENQAASATNVPTAEERQAEATPALPRAEERQHEHARAAPPPAAIQAEEKPGALAPAAPRGEEKQAALDPAPALPTEEQSALPAAGDGVAPAVPAETGQSESGRPASRAKPAEPISTAALPDQETPADPSVAFAVPLPGRSTLAGPRKQGHESGAVLEGRAGNAENAAWERASKTGTKAALEGYLRAYRLGLHASEAKQRLAALDSRPAADRQNAEASAKPQPERQAPYADLATRARTHSAEPAKKTVAEAEAVKQFAPPAAEPQSLDQKQSRRLRWPSSDEPFVDPIPGAR